MCHIPAVFTSLVQQNRLSTSLGATAHRIPIIEQSEALTTVLHSLCPADPESKHIPEPLTLTNLNILNPTSLLIGTGTESIKYPPPLLRVRQCVWHPACFGVCGPCNRTPSAWPQQGPAGKEASSLRLPENELRGNSFQFCQRQAALDTKYLPLSTVNQVTCKIKDNLSRNRKMSILRS